MGIRTSGFGMRPSRKPVPIAAIAAVVVVAMAATATRAAAPRAADVAAGPAAGVVVEAPVQVPAPVTDTDPATVAPGSKAVARRLTTVVADLGKTKRFYEALGFREDRRAEVSDPASLSVFGLDPGARLTFIRMTMDNTLSTGRIDGGTLGFAQVHDRPLPRLRDATRGETMIGMPILVMTTDGIDAVHARLRAIGAEILAPPFAAGGGLTSMIVRDPDGLRMEISQPARPAR